MPEPSLGWQSSAVCAFIPNKKGGRGPLSQITQHTVVFADRRCDWIHPRRGGGAT